MADEARRGSPVCESCEELTRALQRYTDLYEFAPVGYFTLDRSGIIRGANMAAARLAGRDQGTLVGWKFDRLVAEETRPEFDSLLEGISHGEESGTCEVSLLSKDEKPLFVRIEATSCGQGHEFRLAVLDITGRRRSEDALLVSEARYRRLFETAKDGIMVVDAETGEINEVNPFLGEMLAIPREELLGRKLWEIEHFSGFAGSRDHFEALQHREYLLHQDLPIRTRDGRQIVVEVMSTSYQVTDHRVIQYNIRDITIRKQAEDALLKSEEQCRTLISNINEYVYSVRFENGDIRSVYHSPKCLDITGYTPEDYYQDPSLWFTMIHPDDREVVINFLNEIFAGNDHDPIRHRIIHKNGSERWILNNCAVQRSSTDPQAIARLDGFILDITDIKQAEENIFFLAHHDPLTKLPNRSTLYARIEQVLSVAQKARRNVALLFLDIDGFKQINDTMGHDVGDMLLQSIARRLSDCTRSCDVVARLGGDEFVIVLWDCGVSETTVVAEKIIGTGFSLEGSQAAVNTSIGISIYPDDGNDYLELLKCADIAMYHAKKTGGSNFAFFTPKLNQQAHQRFAVEVELRRAIEHDEFVLHYQPKVDLTTGKFSGIEALIRWQHPVRGLIHPEQFIRIAEESGLLTQISKWIIKTVTRQIQQWQQQGIPPVSVAVNLSATFFQHRDFEDTIEQALLETGIPPESLELELTEATIMSDPQKVLGSMAAMKALGLLLSIDDFGTGYSSLSYLKKLPIDKLKIDQSFIHNIASDADNAAVVRAVISIGRSMQLKVIAEGVENASQLAWLQAEGSEEAQGYYFSHPIPAPAITTLLKQRPNFLHNPRGRMQGRH
nr:EAL domain-containing protein [Geomonas sp. Red32]